MIRNEIAIQTKDLTRKFGEYTAVNQINLSIRYGEIFGFLGANGAGKSTTIRLLCGILAPTGGTATVGGYDINTDSEKIKSSIGYVSQKFSLYTDLTVLENLEFYGHIYNISEKGWKNRLNEVLALSGLEPWKNHIAAELSGGWKQRLAIANATLHKPKILFLDEPTAGVDPVSRRSLWELLYELANQGTTLFATTHYMEEAERCHQIAFISQGKILAIGKPADLKANIKGKIIEIECQPLMKASQAFQKLPGVTGLTAYGTSLHLNVDNDEAIRPLIAEAARNESISITSLKTVPASLEDVFATLSEKSA